jgi:oxalate decarboxylase/phosphoglucose isomerase-like protein (cupin superfamily)
VLFRSQPQNVREGTLVIVPSFTLHYVTPNTSHKTRTIISADLLPKLPDHQAINT